MYALKQKKPRYLIKNILDDLYDWAVEQFEEGYAKWSGGCPYGSQGDYPDIVNYNELNSTMYYAIKWELRDELESEIRSCIQNLSEHDAERICKYIGNYEEIKDARIDGKEIYVDEALMFDDTFISAITKKFIERKLNINED